MPIVILIGAVIGIASALNLRVEFPRTDFGPTVSGQNVGPLEFLQYHIVLSMISMIILVALIAVYSRSYIQTRANFMFGLLVVLFALLLQGLLQNPLAHLMISPNLEAENFYSPVSDVFTIVAYAVFLYLSLE